MTYSILARDPAAAEIGVATQSQALAVGSSVPFAVPALGAIASQSIGEPMYGEIGLELLRGGFTAHEALRALKSVDPHVDRRQVAILGVDGGRAVHTGRGCVGAAGHAEGEHCVAIGNTVRGPEVWEMLVGGFEEAQGSLAQRMLAALRAGERAGGDLRGRRSAALVVVKVTPTGRPWHDTVVDLRADDSEDPLEELSRLLELRRRYQRVVRAFQSALDGEAKQADRDLAEFGAPDPAEPDQLLWTALVAALAGRESAAREILDRLAHRAPQFLELARGYRRAGLIPSDLLDRVLPSG